MSADIEVSERTSLKESVSSSYLLVLLIYYISSSYTPSLPRRRLGKGREKYYETYGGEASVGTNGAGHYKGSWYGMSREKEV